MSALAQYYLAKGHEVSGSDLVASEITDFLKKQGIKVATGERKKPAKGNSLPDLVVYSPAVKSKNPELRYFKKKKVKCQSYPEALGDLTKEYFTIAVAGAHGKSTTTAMLGLALAKAGLDPTIVVGTKVKEFGPPAGGTNFRIGLSKLLVIEACEYDSSFLNYFPKIIIITNVDKEHLDYFKTFNNVLKAFRKFALKLPVDGVLVINKDDQNSAKALQTETQKYNFKIAEFGAEQTEAKKIKKILRVPGKHNVSNALAALAAARVLAVPDDVCLKAFSEFKGTWRRFETRQGKAGGKKITVISDYGHHPTEIEATFSAARQKYPKKKIWCVFQPHQHQRTYYLFDQFVKTFRQAPVDNVIITDIYDVAGRETKKISKEVSSRKLANKVDKESVRYCALSNVEKLIKENIKEGDVLLIMGAGDIYKFADKF